MGQTSKVTDFIMHLTKFLLEIFSAYRDKLERSVTADQMAFQVFISSSMTFQFQF